MGKKSIIFSLIIIAIFIADVSFGQGCSQCKLISEQSAEAGEAAFATNINKGILFLLAIPYIILVVFLRKHIVRWFKKLIHKNEEIAH